LWEAKPKWYFSGITVPFNTKTKKIEADEETLQRLKNEAEAVRLDRQRTIAQNILKESETVSAGDEDERRDDSSE
jgi:hypothetical protein